MTEYGQRNSGRLQQVFVCTKSQTVELYLIAENNWPVISIDNMYNILSMTTTNDRQAVSNRHRWVMSDWVKKFLNTYTFYNNSYCVVKINNIVHLIIPICLRGSDRGRQLWLIASAANQQPDNVENWGCKRKNYNTTTTVDIQF